MKTVRNLIGPTIRRIRCQQLVSQACLAEKCQRLGWSISRDIVAAIEGQRRQMTEIELVVMAKALNMSPEELLPTLKDAVRVVAQKT